MDLKSRFEVQNGCLQHWQPQEVSPGFMRMCLTTFSPEQTEGLRQLLHKDYQARREQKLLEIQAKMEEYRVAMRQLDQEYQQCSGGSPFVSWI